MAFKSDTGHRPAPLSSRMVSASEGTYTMRSYLKAIVVILNPLGVYIVLLPFVA